MNPAGSWHRRGVVVSGDFNNRFGLAELNSGALLASGSSGVVTGSVRLYSFGFPLYREWTGGVGLSTLLSVPDAHLLLGARMEGHSSRATGFRARRAVAISLGMLVQSHLAPISVGIGLHNLNRPALGGLPMDRGLSAGASARLAPEFLVSAQYHQSWRNGGAWAVGLELDAVETLTIRMGYHAGVQALSMGLDLKLRSLRCSVGLQRHSVLGWSSSLTLARRSWHTEP